MIIRRVKPSDAAAVAEIYNYYVLNTDISFETARVDAVAMGRRISEISSSYPFLVCEDAGVLVGYCYAHRWKDRTAYERTAEVTVYVDPTKRRRGIGTLLMGRLIEECKTIGLHALVACITAPNDASVGLHAGFGFERVSYFKEVGTKFGRRLDVYDYELIID